MIASYKDNGFGLWAVVSKSDNKLIGYCGIHKITINDNKIINELAYRIYKLIWGKGFATQAAIAVKEYARGLLKLKKLSSCIDANNKSSIRVAEKNGLKYTKDCTFRGKPCRLYQIVF